MTALSAISKIQYVEVLKEKVRRAVLRDLKKFARRIPVPGVPFVDIDDDENENAPLLCNAYLEPALHHDYIMESLQKAVEGGCRNIMLFLPPGSAKSTYGSVVFTAWFMGRFPKSNVIHCTYGTDFSRKIARKTRATCRSAEYTEITDAYITPGNDALLDWSLNNGSTYMGAGIQSGVTGNRADLIVIDDPVKSREEADSETIREKVYSGYQDDILTRKKPGAVEVIIMTRWHEDDLAGRILGEGWKGESGLYETSDGVTWNIIRIPAVADRKDDPIDRKIGDYLWPQWFTPEYWKDIRRRQPVRTWTALYQQSPAPEDGDFFERSWFRRYRVGAEPSELNVYQAADFAVSEGKGDFTEIGICGFDALENMYVLDWWTGQETADVWIEHFLRLAKERKPFVSVAEGGLIRRSVEPFLKKRMQDTGIYTRMEWLSSNQNKAANARGFQALASMGKVYIPHTEWGDELINQLISFPTGKYDDKVDVCGLFGRILDQTYSPSTLGIPTKKQRNDAYNEDEEEDGDAWVL
jgi:predicted phage terminase large subunit-like protein